MNHLNRCREDIQKNSLSLPNKNKQPHPPPNKKSLQTSNRRKLV